MLQGRAVKAIIPARGGSKGIPGKNLYRIGGLSLVERAAALARQCAWVDATYVSTDHAQTYKIAQTIGCATPKPRPAALASDSARTIDVIADLVSEGVVGATDVVLLLQPTSPLRTAADLEDLFRRFNSDWNRADAVVSVCKVDGPHPYKVQIVENTYLRPLLGRDASVPRQSLRPVFLPNGAFYLGKVDVLLAENTFMPQRSLPFEMRPIASVNLDVPLDLLLLEAILKSGLAKLDDGATSLTAPPGVSAPPAAV